MKRILLLMLGCLVVCLALALASCGEKQEQSVDSVCTEHTGGRATCEALAKCENCGEEYGELGAHKKKTVEGAQPSCTKSGLTEGVECSVCHEVIAEQKEVFPTGHKYGGNYTCTVCGHETVPSEGLEYCNEIDDYYNIIGCRIMGIGECEDEELVIPSFYGSLPVVSIDDHAFGDCNNIKSVVIGENVKHVGDYAFTRCESLESIVLIGGDKTIGESAFDGCNNLKCINFIGTVEQWCSISFCSNIAQNGENLSLNGEAVTELVIPEGVTSIEGSAFRGFGSITSVTMPRSVVYIGDYAFANCVALKSVTVSDGVTRIDMCAFQGCAELESVKLGKGIVEIEDFAFANCVALKSVTLPDSVTRIDMCAFQGCAELETVTLSKELEFIGFDAFDGCENLKCEAYGNGRYLGNAENPYMALVKAKHSNIAMIKIHEKTKIISSAFERCNELTEVVIPHGVTVIGDSAFAHCRGLVSVTIPDSVTVIGDSAFLDCISLETVAIGRGVVTIGDRAFADCEGLVSVTMPDSVTVIGDSAFLDCISLETVAIGRGVVTIGDSAFAYCEGLVSVTIPDSVTVIGNSAFRDCISLETVAMGRGVVTIGNRAFRDCKNLTVVTIYDSVKEIGAEAFYGCKSLTEALFECARHWVVSVGFYVDVTQTELDEMDLLNSTTAASYLTKEYVNRRWHRR